MKSTLISLLVPATLLAAISAASAASYVLNTRGPSPSGDVQTTWITSGTTDLPTGPGGNNRLNSWAIIDATNYLLISVDLSQILSDAAGQDIVVNSVKIEALRSGWATGWASTSIFSVNPFTPNQAIWDNQPGQQTYMGDVGGNNVFTMTWDSANPGSNTWDSVFVNLVADVQGDIDNNRTADYVMRVNTGNEWSATIGTDSLAMTVDVTFVPEPSSALLAGLLPLVLLRRRR
jgi:hypothetical protein